MASRFSSTVFAASIPSSSSAAKARSLKNLAPGCSPTNFLRYNPLSARSSVPRVRATLLRDEDKVIVEESVPSKIPSIDTNKGSIGESSSSSSSNTLEKWVIKLEQSTNTFLTDSVIKILDAFYHDRHYARFFVLETIARVPYFAFISVLHLYESFGWWRRADYLKVHFAESWNEMHHLLIMEELGGNSWWFDRFLAQHIAVVYYFMTVLMYAISPRMAWKSCIISDFEDTNG